MKYTLLAGLLITASILTGCGTSVSYTPGGLEPAAGIDITNQIAVGSGKDVITLFADFQCPGCQAFHREVESYFRELAESGTITFEQKNYPLNGHASAYKDALAALCAASVGKYGEYRDALYTHETKRNEIGVQ